MKAIRQLEEAFVKASLQVDLLVFEEDGRAPLDSSLVARRRTKENYKRALEDEAAALEEQNESYRFTSETPQQSSKENEDKTGGGKCVIS